MRKAAVFLLLSLTPASGCSRFAPEDATVIEAPAVYRAWWDSTEQCSGLRARFERVHWYVVPGNQFECPDGRCAARWESDHSIYIAADWIDHPLVVRHEMLHDLIGHAGHPDPPFGQGCALTWTTWNPGSALRAAPAGID